MRFATPKTASTETQSQIRASSAAANAAAAMVAGEAATATTSRRAHATSAEGFPSLKKLRQQAAAARYWMRPVSGGGSATAGSDCSSDVSYLNLGLGRGRSSQNSHAKKSSHGKSTTKATAKVRTKSGRTPVAATIRRREEAGRIDADDTKQRDSHRREAVRDSVDTLISKDQSDVEHTQVPFATNIEEDAPLRMEDIDTNIISSEHKVTHVHVPTRHERAERHSESMMSNPASTSREFLPRETSGGRNAPFPTPRTLYEHNLPTIGDDDAFIFASDIDADDYNLDFFEARKRSGRPMETSSPPQSRAAASYAETRSHTISPHETRTPTRNIEASLRGRASDMYERLREAETRVDGQNQTIHALEDELRHSRRQADALHAELDRFRDEIRRLRSARARLDPGDAAAGTSDAGISNQRHAALISELRSREALAKYQIASLESRVRELKQRELRLSESSSPAFARAKEAIRQRDEANHEVVALKNRIKHLMSSSETSRNTCRAAQQRLSEQEQTNEKLRARLENKLDRTRRLEDELAGANRTISSLKMRVEKLENDLEDAVRCARHIGDEVAKREAARHADAMREANSRYFQLEGKIEKLHDDRIQLQNTNKRLQARVREVLEANRAISRASRSREPVAHCDENAADMIRGGAQTPAATRARRAKYVSSSGEGGFFMSSSRKNTKSTISGHTSATLYDYENDHMDDGRSTCTSDCSTDVHLRPSPSATLLQQRMRPGGHVARKKKSSAHRRHVDQPPLTTDYAALMDRFRRVARHAVADSS